MADTLTAFEKKRTQAVSAPGRTPTERKALDGLTASEIKKAAAP